MLDVVQCVAYNLNGHFRKGTAVNQEIQLDGCPLRLGNPLKVPSGAWANWGIGFASPDEFRALVGKSEECYASEWSGTDDRGLRDIAAAAKEAGLADCNARLNEAVAEAVCREVRSSAQEVSILDVGAGSGSTSLAVLRSLADLGRRVVVSVVDPSCLALRQAEERIRGSGLVAAGGVLAYALTDIAILGVVPPASFDVVISSAALHHHGFLEPAVAALAGALRPGGVLVIGDWHNSMWLYPGRVYEFLSSLEWSGKADALRDFSRSLPTSAPHEYDALLAKANEQICAFWRAYALARTPGLPAYQMLEGHRPAEEYDAILTSCGLNVLSCRRLISGSELLCVHVARR
jgi:SAM-dependent methyltransferase